MNRFFLPETETATAPVVGAEVALADEDALHIARVLRLTIGEQVVLVIAPDCEALAELTVVSAKSVRARTIALRTVRREPPLRIRLAQGVAKGEKMDYIVQKSTEMGVSEIVPVVTERSIVRLDRERGEERAQRWQKIAREAAQQSGRTVVPRVLPPMAFAAALPGATNAGATANPASISPATADGRWLSVIPYEGEAGRGLYDTLAAWREHPESRSVADHDGVPAVTVFIGPEGGFADREVAAAIAAGCVPVSLGPRILRTETAGPAAIAMILYHLGDLGRALPATGPWEE